MQETIDWERFERTVIPGETIVRCVRGTTTPINREWDWMAVGYEGIYMNPHPNRDDPGAATSTVWVQPFSCLRDQPVDVHMLDFWIDNRWYTFDEVMA